MGVVGGTFGRVFLPPSAAIDEEVTAWRSRPIDPVWPIVYFVGLVVHVRGGNGQVSQHTIYLAIREASKKWTTPIPKWKAALNHFAILFENRLPQPQS